MSETVYARSPDVVWRLAPDRVLVRRVGGPSEDAADLIGGAALAWLALDEPGTMAEVIVRLSGTKVNAFQGDAIDQLHGGGWLTALSTSANQTWSAPQAVRHTGCSNTRTKWS